MPVMEPTDLVSKGELMAAVQADRERFDRILNAVPPELMSGPILAGGWSVKDVLAHIAWADREGVGVARTRALIGSELWQLPEDERNEAVVRESRSTPLDDVVGEYRAAFREYVAALDELSDDELNDPGRFDGLAKRIPGWRPWRVLYDPGHYDEHGRAIEEAMNAIRAARGTG